MRRGTLAAFVLATLFIVAQIVSAFLSEVVGLVFGGVAAGLLLFVLQPIRKGIERFGGRGRSSSVPPADGQAEATYRNALRFALKEHGLSRDEELHLADLGERLGITARRARELRFEIEAGPSEARCSILTASRRPSVRARRSSCLGTSGCTARILCRG